MVPSQPIFSAVLRYGDQLLRAVKSTPLCHRTIATYRHTDITAITTVTIVTCKRSAAVVTTTAEIRADVESAQNVRSTCVIRP